MPIYKKYQLGKFTYSNIEVRDLLKSWLMVSIAFAIVLGGLSSKFFSSFIISLIVVGTGFLLHELGHKIVAQRYKYFAEFRSFDEMLFLAVIMSFFGFVFAAPGAVMIGGKSIRKDHNGIISMAGPLVNVILVVVFLGLFVISSGFLQTIASYGVRINAWLALFNLIPFWQFDGKKIFEWNKVVWGVMTLLSLAFVYYSFTLGAQ